LLVYVSRHLNQGDSEKAFWVELPPAACLTNQARNR